MFFSKIFIKVFKQIWLFFISTFWYKKILKRFLKFQKIFKIANIIMN